MSFEDIIGEIQDKPILWMSADPNHKNRQMRAKLWSEMATKLGIEEDVLKKRWKHLKDHYRKELKKKPNSRYGYESDEYTSPWKYFRSMEFIRNEVMPPASYNGNFSHLEAYNSVDILNKEDSADVDLEFAESFVASPASERSSEPYNSRPAPTSRKRVNVRAEMLEIERKKIKLLEKTLNESSEEEYLRNDVDYLFLRSILPSMKKLTEYQKLCFRGRINDWLLEALAPGKD